MLRHLFYDCACIRIDDCACIRIDDNGCFSESLIKMINPDLDINVLIGFKYWMDPDQIRPVYSPNWSTIYFCIFILSSI